MKELLLNIESKEWRLATIKYGQLDDLVIERKKTRQLTGNIYKGKVTNILENIQSAFIDIDEQDNGFIHISDILENAKKFQEMFDIDFEWEQKHQVEESKPQDISKLLSKDQFVLVQVVKEAIGSKGARLTSNISLPGRYLVMLPNSSHRGVSRKIQERNDRERLKKIIKSFDMPQDMGLICRTASVHASTEELVDEATHLVQQWNQIVEDYQKMQKPTCLYQESDILKRAVIKGIDKKYDRLLVDDHKAYLACQALKDKIAKDSPLVIEYYKDSHPMFERFGVEREIDKVLKKKIWLPSGGYLFFERTEAMHTIDVNSGRSNLSAGSLNTVEEALVQINMEAAKEIARQLRVRNIGGLIICDFIDMRSRKNQRRVMDTLKEAMKDDSAKCTILGMSEFGLVEMTRQRSKESLAQTLFTPCMYCNGLGMIKSDETTSIEIERLLKKLLANAEHHEIRLCVHPILEKHLLQHEKDFFDFLAKKYNSKVKISSDDNMHLNDYKFISLKDGSPIEV